MDNYPEHLAPEFNEGGGIITPFETWWENAKSFYKNVPEEVAREWIHRHWKYSPFSWLPSKEYFFELISFPSKQLFEIQNLAYRKTERAASVIKKGEHLYHYDKISSFHRENPPFLWKYMRTKQKFPSPIIILDNFDDHLSRAPYVVGEDYPTKFILVEGHTRHEIGTYMASIGEMKDFVDVYIMRKLKP